MRVEEACLDDKAETRGTTRNIDHDFAFLLAHRAIVRFKLIPILMRTKPVF